MYSPGGGCGGGVPFATVWGIDLSVGTPHRRATAV